MNNMLNTRYKSLKNRKIRGSHTLAMFVWLFARKSAQVVDVSDYVNNQKWSIIRYIPGPCILEWGIKKNASRLHFLVFPQSPRGFRTTFLAFPTILEYGTGYVATVVCTSGCKHRHRIYIWCVNFSKYIFVQLLTKVWPGLTAFPDFTDPGTQAYWEQMLSKFRELVEFDGLWIDMNEPSNELDGSTKGCPANSPLDHPPYKTHVSGDNLYSRTLCMSAKHHSYSHYDVHSLYGLTEMEQTMR